ncbi:MAG: hypothetical protein A3G34_07595 [Candidatus Lindowbacteria bacterium RIFCSPLOWO2_12_FULL_62_27]|nr:MAG: hypothetical protein A3I06_00625 [Candidatus Lindowbacteria bacterium RIFCSPLOWO2_02_FULL_62_12]OGH59674.1 MAG: hypothetical protein A3G34_07595 [Candidatus Lindowbacteria bacterium RIFCSPLOWO2_12_FULL_62_27]
MSTTYHVNDFLKMMVDNGASDLILKTGSAPAMRINRALVKIEMEPLSPDAMEKLCLNITDWDKVSKVKAGEEQDMAYSLAGAGRFRVNMFRQRGSLGMVFRHIKGYIPNFEELMLPQVMFNLCNFQYGIFLVTGTTGSGKSTTLAAMVDYINTSMAKHIVTIEDPIEYLHKDKMSVVTQREIGLDTINYGAALKFVLRQNPDIILVGEMRDKETVDTAFAAAETGHLVFSTLHTANAPQTIERILEFYQEVEKERMRTLMSEFLVAVVSQRLVPKADGKGMVPNVEIMIQTPIIKKLIIDNRVPKLKSAIHQGRQEGLQTFDQSLVDLFNAGLISNDEARIRASKPAAWELYLKGHFPDIDTGILG